MGLRGPAHTNHDFEWRRRYSQWGVLISVIVAVVTTAVGLLFGFFGFAAEHTSSRIALLGAAIAAFGCGLAHAISTRFFADRQRDVLVRPDFIRVDSRIVDQHLLGGYLASAGLAVALVGLLFAAHNGDLPHVPLGVQIGCWIALTLLLASFGQALLANPFDRHLEFCKDGLELHLGESISIIPWDSIRSVEPWAGRSGNLLAKGMYSGVIISADTRAIYTRRVPWPTTHPDQHLLGGFSVDEDTLYNVIVALHEHPELRPLLSTPEGAVLFEGPPREVRDRMTPNQVWLPWERNITAALEAGREGPSA